MPVSPAIVRSPGEMLRREAEPEHLPFLALRARLIWQRNYEQNFY
jgi:hypothetical protein